MQSFSKLWLLLVFLGLPMLLVAQNNSDSKVIKTTEGKFIIHKVEKGQTLYAISKMYSVSVEDIKKANPDIQEFGIRIDQTLRIPTSSVNKKEAKRSEIELSGDTIYHEVLKKETLYALSKKYEISIEDIEKFNPTVKDGLKIGMIVKIPSVPESQQKSTAEEFQKPKSDSLMLHEVMPKETLYSLSKEYDISPDSIQMVNDGLQEGLKVGVTIRIPVENPVFIPDAFANQIDTLHYDSGMALKTTDTIVVGIFLPFCTEQNTLLQEENNTTDVYGLTEISMQFYRGFNLATDSLRNLGYNIDLRYFDTKNDTAQCAQLLMNMNLLELDLVIGPLYQTNFKCISQKAKQLGIPIVSPVKVSSSLLLNNRYVVKSFASAPSMVIHLAEYVGSNYADSNVSIISGGDKKDKRYANIFQKHYNNATNDSIPVNKIWQASKSNFSKFIKPDTHNYIAIMSSNEAFVSQSMSILYRMTNTDTKITIFGLDSWHKFKSIGFDYMDTLNVTFPIQKHTDYSNPSVIHFIENYRSTYFTEPSEHVFSAFDVAMYFIPALFHSNGKWEEYIDTHMQSGLSTRFDFVKISKESGFENGGGFILEYKDYELILKD